MKPDLDLLLEAAVADHETHLHRWACEVCKRETPPGAPQAYLGTFTEAGLRQHMLQVHGFLEARP